MRRFFRIVSVVVSLAVFGDLAHAHHSQAGIFDSRKTIEITGVVKSVSWPNPHGQIEAAQWTMVGRGGVHSMKGPVAFADAIVSSRCSTR